MLLPNFLCLGPPKCGTTWLYSCLSQHPEIFIPQEKEIHFFNVSGGIDVYRTKGLTWYARFYRQSRPGQLRGDLSPSYFHNDYVPARIKEVLPDCKMIIILRNPVDRAYSEYWMWLRRGEMGYSFEELIRRNGKDSPPILETGLYAQHLERYLQHFPRNKFLILLTEDIKKTPERVLADVYRFLGVDPGFQAAGARDKSNEAFEIRSPQVYLTSYRVARALNLNGLDWLRRAVKRTGIPKTIRRLNYYKKSYPPLSEESRAALTEYYREDIKKLSVLLNRNLDHWLK